MKGLSFNFLSEYFPLFIEGLVWTLLIALLAVIFGVILGSILCFMKKSKFILLKVIANIYIEIVRGTPVLLQVYIVYFGLTAFGIKLGAFTSAIIALSVNSAAYVAEIIRSGIEAVDNGQMEAARSLGMTSKMAMLNIILPQAIKNILPAIGNEFVAVIKESSMASVIGVAEIMYASKIVTGATYRSMEPLMIAAIFYFILTFTLGRIMGYLERRLKASDSR
ncbi:amino acid ABC transporter permease [Clostridium sp.]|uniref:amino acid ABC transporter permease n=1 Tax=Clostridium sp. TaxID=1506 RepID=UPI001D7F1372|nr:amino acid ABC transporter permease [Clostridium sp.]MBS5986986.1 amino acid ABC transporter permease [Clostridium sp.]